MPKPVPPRAPAADRQVQITALVPAPVKRAVQRRAVEEGTTIRTVLLRALMDAGVAEVPADELTDRRGGSPGSRARRTR